MDAGPALLERHLRQIELAGIPILPQEDAIVGPEW